MFISFGPEVGYQVFTTSGAFNDSGKPQVVYFANMLSGGTLSQPTFYDGTSSLGTGAATIQGIASQWVQFNPGVGLVFPKGCFVSFDGNTSKVVVWGRQFNNQ